MSARKTGKTVATLRTRDGDCCWICHRGLDFTRRVPHPYAPTLDHVIERSKGGSNALTNLRLACRVCNERRSNGAPVHKKKGRKPSDTKGAERLEYAAEQRKRYSGFLVRFCQTCGGAIWQRWEQRELPGRSPQYVHATCRDGVE